MDDSKKRKIVAIVEEDELYKKTLIIIVEKFFNSIEKQIVSEKDPFEKYLKEVHLRLFKEIKDYSERAINGRIAILNELRKENNTKAPKF